MITITFIRPKGLLSGNWPDERFFITYPPAQSNVYQNIYIYIYIFKEEQKQKQKKTKTKKAKDTIEERKYLWKI